MCKLVRAIELASYRVRSERTIWIFILLDKNKLSSKFLQTNKQKKNFRRRVSICREIGA